MLQSWLFILKYLHSPQTLLKTPVPTRNERGRVSPTNFLNLAYSEMPILMPIAKLLFFVFLCCSFGVSYAARTTKQQITDLPATNSPILDSKLTWQQQAADMPEPLSMCFFMERNTTLMYDYNRMQAAVDVAVQYVNEMVLSPYYYINLVYVDLGPDCPVASLSNAPAFALNLWEKGVQCKVYVGPGKANEFSIVRGCGYASDAINNIAETWDIPIIGLPAASIGVNADPQEYYLLTRISVTFPTIQRALLKFLKHFNYTSTAFFTDMDLTLYAEMGAVIESTMRDVQTSAVIGDRLSFTFDQFNSRGYNEQLVRSFLQKITELSTVIVVFTDGPGLRTFMQTAYSLGMTSGRHIFIAVEFYKSQIWGRFRWNIGQRDDYVIREAYRSVMLLSLSLEEAGVNAKDLVAFWNDVIKRSQKVYGYNGFTKFDRENIDPIVVHAYEAVLLYGYTILKMHSDGLNISSGALFTNYTAGTTFDSPITGLVVIDPSSDREMPYIMRVFSDISQQHETLFGFPIRQKDLVELGEIRFVGRPQLPANILVCLDRARCTSAEVTSSSSAVAAVVVVFILLLISVPLIAVYFLRKNKRNENPYWWRILVSDLNFYSQRSSSEWKRKSKLTASEYSEKSDRLRGLKKQSTVVANGAANGDMDVSVRITEDGEEQQEAPLIRSAMLLGVRVTVVDLPKPKHRVPGDILSAASLANILIHRNVQKFIGIAVTEDNQCDSFVGEICHKGTLRDLIADVSVNLDWEFKSALMKDLVNGMAYLHMSKLRSHGFLNDETCLIDNRFILKISSFGFSSLRHERDLQMLSGAVEERNYNILLWRAPELLRRTMPANGTQAGDVYSFAIILQQIVLRSAPYHIGGPADNRRKSYREEISDRDIVQDVRRGLVPSLRPSVPLSACPAPLHELMTNCWDDQIDVRPAFAKIKPIVTKIAGRAGENIVDHLIKRMEQYAAGLEYQVEQKMKQFMEERQRSSALLSGLLPKPVADALSRGTQIVPETFEHTTVYFGDVAGFSQAIDECRSPFEAVEMLNTLYTACDAVVASYDVYKVETTNDAYLVVSGLPVRNDTKHAEQIASMALGLRKEIGTLRTTLEKGKNFKLRAGLHSGSCVAGVIGLKMPKYCVFGDTVNTASRMESHGEAGKIQMSGSTKTVLDKYDDFIVIERGTIDIKGKGPMMTYWLIGRN